MIRYIILLYVRPEGALDAAFDPWLITVTARDDQSALAVAVADAQERGWEALKPSIVKKEPAR